MRWLRAPLTEIDISTHLATRYPYVRACAIYDLVVQMRLSFRTARDFLNWLKERQHDTITL